jgi:hypothetical protein
MASDRIAPTFRVYITVPASDYPQRAQPVISLPQLLDSAAKTDALAQRFRLSL